MNDTNADEVTSKRQNLENAMSVFLDEINEWSGEEELTRIAADFNRGLAPDVRVALLFQMLTANNESCECLSEGDKHLAVALGHEMGPDWSNWLYRFGITASQMARD